MLIAIEGIDGVGKTTVAMLLADKLNATYLKFPDRTTVSGQEIARVLTGSGDIPITPVAFQALQHVNRLEHLGTLIAADESPTNHVVCDRYVASGIVYGEADGVDGNWLALLADSLPKPDVNILLIGNLQNIEGQRLAGRDRETYEREGIAAMEKRQNIYKEIWRTAHADGRWHVFDSSMDSAADIVQMILALPRIRFGCGKAVQRGLD